MTSPPTRPGGGAAFFLRSSLVGLAITGLAVAGGDPEGKANLASNSKLPSGPGFAAKFKADAGPLEFPQLLARDRR